MKLNFIRPLGITTILSLAAVFQSCETPNAKVSENGEFEQMIAGGGSAVAYAWFVWEKGFNGQTELKWFN